MNTVQPVSIVDYDHVKEMASISYTTPKGQQSIWIHRTTFDRLMNNKWEIEKMGEPTLYQREMKESVKNVISGNYLQWFDEQTNIIMQRQVRCG